MSTNNQTSSSVTTAETNQGQLTLQPPTDTQDGATNKVGGAQEAGTIAANAALLHTLAKFSPTALNTALTQALTQTYTEQEGQLRSVLAQLENLAQQRHQIVAEREAIKVERDQLLANFELLRQGQVVTGMLVAAPNAPTANSTLNFNLHSEAAVSVTQWAEAEAEAERVAQRAAASLAKLRGQPQGRM